MVKLKAMEWIYLSPHLDDAAFSCGGLVWEQNQAGEPASIWTLFAGRPPEGALSPYAQSLHNRWNTPDQETVDERRAEDLRSSALLGAGALHFSLPDCIYRRDPQSGAYLYASEEAIFGALNAREERRVRALSEQLRQRLKPGVQVVCPLGIGGHVDHQFTRKAAEYLSRPLWYYADYPYVLEIPDLAVLPLASGLEPVVFPLSKAGFEAWVQAAAAHRSQISTFWEDPADIRRDFQSYVDQAGGIRLWRAPA